MFGQYFSTSGVRPEFKKEFISLFDGWLGKANLGKLDTVTRDEWLRFHSFITELSAKYDLMVASLQKESLTPENEISAVLPGFEEDKEKGSDQFLRLVIPKLDCILTEEWDYTYILWHKENGAKEKLSPLIKSAGLYHWSD